jgi:hypothetical protein
MEFETCSAPTDWFPSLSSLGAFRVAALMPRDVFPIPYARNTLIIVVAPLRFGHHLLWM